MSFGDDTLDPGNIAELQREAALRRSFDTLRALTHGHDMQQKRNFGEKSAICHCNACETRRVVSQALETYETR